MRLAVSDIYTYYRPSKCPLRVFLRHRRESESPPGPFEEVLHRLGVRHEKIHLATFKTVVDLSKKTMKERIQGTRETVSRKASVIYQPLLEAGLVVNDAQCQVVGVPDLLIHDSGQYVIRDCKISRRINEKDHPEIFLQLDAYGWLYEQTFGEPPARLEVYSGTGEIIPLPHGRGSFAMPLLRRILTLKEATTAPYSPVGWTKCGRCPFNHRCWPRAEQSGDVALVSGVDQGMAVALRARGVQTAEKLLKTFSERQLARLRRPWGGGMRRVGKQAQSVLQMAHALTSGEEILLAQPRIPEHPNYVMFDLEGLPPQLDEMEKIYLWGLQVFGQEPGEYQAAVAGFGIDGDQQGWVDFLAKAGGILDRYGDLPFVHWHHYERVRLEMYLERYDDLDGTGARVHQNLLDLLPITREAIALPLPSYSLKVVEDYVGFQRAAEDYGGDWAMATYIEATETENEAARAQLLDEILAYNKEDLAATWAVLNWLKAKRG